MIAIVDCGRDFTWRYLVLVSKLVHHVLSLGPWQAQKTLKIIIKTQKGRETIKKGGGSIEYIDPNK